MALLNPAQALLWTLNLGDQMHDCELPRFDRSQYTQEGTVAPASSPRLLNRCQLLEGRCVSGISRANERFGFGFAFVKWCSL